MRIKYPFKALIYCILWNTMVGQVNESDVPKGRVNCSSYGSFLLLRSVEILTKVHKWNACHVGMLC